MECENCGETTNSVRCESCGHRKVEHLSVEEVETYLKKAKKTLRQHKNREKSK